MAQNKCPQSHPQSQGNRCINIPASLQLGETALRCVLHRVSEGPLRDWVTIVPSSHPTRNAPVIGFFPFPVLRFYSVTMLPPSSIMCPNFLSQGYSRENLTGHILLNPSHSQRKENPNYALYFLPTIYQSLFRTRNNRYFWEKLCSPLPKYPSIHTKYFLGWGSRCRTQSGLRNTQYAVNFTYSIIKCRCCWLGHNYQTVSNTDAPAALLDGSQGDVQGSQPPGMHVQGYSASPP